MNLETIQKAIDNINGCMLLELTDTSSIVWEILYKFSAYIISIVNLDVVGIDMRRLISTYIAISDAFKKYYTIQWNKGKTSFQDFGVYNNVIFREEIIHDHCITQFGSGVYLELKSNAVIIYDENFNIS